MNPVDIINFYLLADFGNLFQSCNFKNSEKNSITNYVFLILTKFLSATNSIHL